MIYIALIYSYSRIVYMNVEISRDTKFSNWRLCDALSFFKVVVNIKDKDSIGDKDSVEGEDNIRNKNSVGGEDNIGDRGSKKDRRSLVIILVTFITLFNYPLCNYKYLNG